jgi:hypothetical protein
MSNDIRQRLIFTFVLHAGIAHPGRFVTRIRKHLGRVWGIDCDAIGEPAEVHRLQKIIEGLTDRVAAKSEVLTALAERRNVS